MLSCCSSKSGCFSITEDRCIEDYGKACSLHAAFFAFVFLFLFLPTKSKTREGGGGREWDPWLYGRLENPKYDSARLPKQNIARDNYKLAHHCIHIRIVTYG